MDATTSGDYNQLREVVEELVRIRHQQGLRQVDVARALKLSQPAISEFERGLSQPRVDTVQKYAMAVGAELTFSVKAPDNEQDGQ